MSAQKNRKDIEDTEGAKRMESARTTQDVKTADTAEQAFEAAFQENWRRVVGVLSQLVGDGGEAEDLALETFWRLHDNPPPQATPDSLRGWLYRVATNLGLNALRARQRRQRYETHAGALDLQERPVDDPAQEVERRQERERVRQALAGLKPRSAQLLLLRHSGFSYAEMAAALGLAPGSVGTLLARAEVEFEDRYRRLAE
jgi:RNA polymerase sigma-70 factor (ECF subfamily)